MAKTETKKRFTGCLRRLERAVADAPESDRILLTPDADEWAETSLSREQLEATLRKGRVHRHRGQT